MNKSNRHEWNNKLKDAFHWLRHELFGHVTKQPMTIYDAFSTELAGNRIVTATVHTQIKMVGSKLLSFQTYDFYPLNLNARKHQIRKLYTLSNISSTPRWPFFMLTCMAAQSSLTGRQLCIVQTVVGPVWKLFSGSVLILGQKNISRGPKKKKVNKRPGFLYASSWLTHLTHPASPLTPSRTNQDHFLSDFLDFPPDIGLKLLQKSLKQLRKQNPTAKEWNLNDCSLFCSSVTIFLLQKLLFTHRSIMKHYCHR